MLPAFRRKSRTHAHTRTHVEGVRHTPVPRVGYESIYISAFIHQANKCGNNSSGVGQRGERGKRGKSCLETETETALFIFNRGFSMEFVLID